MKECFKKLQELIDNVVLADIEDQIDSIFELITKDKNSKDKYTEQLNELYEMRTDFNEILQEIENKELTKEECVELYAEIFDMISGDQ